MDWALCVEQGTDVATLACIPVIIKLVVNAALVFSGIVALFFIIFSGVKYITSNGDQAKIDSAKKTLTYAIIGLIVIFMSFTILSIISSITGVKEISNPGF